MGRLFLMRHARAAWAEPGTRDFDRGLTQAGRDEAEAIGSAMAAAGLVPSRVVCSPARRAVETWQGLARAMGLNAGQAMLSATLYASDAGGYLTILRNNAGTGTDALLIVGHNPMIEDLAVALSASGDEAARASLAGGYPTGALSVFALSPDPGSPLGFSARLESFRVPSDP